ncbi:MAG: ester cyclase [Allosphingosinicella sp.]
MARLHRLAMLFAAPLLMAGAAGVETPPLGYTLPDAPFTADRAQEHANKRLFLDAARGMFVDRDLSAIERYYSDSYVNHDPHRQVRARELGLTDRQMTRAFFEQFLQAFPDVTLTIDQLYAEGDRVIAFTTWRGTHRGNFMGMPPTGQSVVIRAAEVFRIVDGRFQEHWDIADQSGLIAQPSR